MAFCLSCGAPVPDGSKFCPNCGDPVHTAPAPRGARKHCQHCGGLIDRDCVVCPLCGRQVAALQTIPQQPVVVRETRTVYRDAHNGKNKWVAFFLCLLGGVIGLHKFYEGKILLGILYICTAGLFGIGVLVDLISLFFKPNPYYV